MTSHTSRRAILAGAAPAAIATVAAISPACVSAAAVISTDADPIFDAIEAHRKADDAYRAANKARDRAGFVNEPQIIVGHYKEGSYDLGPDGKSLIWTPNGRTQPIYAKDADSIKESVPRDLDPTAAAAWLKERMAELEQAEQLIAEQKASKLQVAEDAAYEIERDRMWELIWTVPTTLQGLTALFQYYQTSSILELIREDEWQEVQEWSITAALCDLTGQLRPQMNKMVAEYSADEDADAAEA